MKRFYLPQPPTITTQRLDSFEDLEELKNLIQESPQGFLNPTNPGWTDLLVDLRRDGLWSFPDPDAAALLQGIPIAGLGDILITSDNGYYTISDNPETFAGDLADLDARLFENIYAEL